MKTFVNVVSWDTSKLGGACQAFMCVWKQATLMLYFAIGSRKIGGARLDVCNHMAWLGPKNVARMASSRRALPRYVV